MYVHGTRLLADRTISGTRLAVQAQVIASRASAQAAPTATRWQRACRAARAGATACFELGFDAPRIFVVGTNIAHAIEPATCGDFGVVRMAGSGSYLPTMSAVMLGGLALGASGKERGGINLARPSADISAEALSQYGVLGLPEFALTVAATKLRASGRSTLAAACATGALLLAAALELPRLAYHLVHVALSLGCALVLGTIGAALGFNLGALQRAPPHPVAAGDHLGVDEASRAAADAARRIRVPANFVAQLSAITSNDELRAALRVCTKDAATFTACTTSLEALRTQLEAAAKPNVFVYAKDTAHLALLERLVGPIDDMDAFSAAFRQRSRRIHPDRLSALRLDADSEQLLMSVWLAMQAGSDLAQATRTLQASDARAAA